MDKTEQEYQEEIKDLEERLDELKTKVRMFTHDEYKTTTRQELVDSGKIHGWLLDDGNVNDEVLFHESPTRLRLKMKTTFEPDYLNIDFTKEYWTPEGERKDEPNESV